MEEVTISEFKAKCLTLIKQVFKTKKPIRVTKSGKPIADVVPPVKQDERELARLHEGRDGDHRRMSMVRLANLRGYEMHLQQQVFAPLRFFAVAILMASVWLVARCLAQPTAQDASTREEMLERFLRSYDGNPASADKRTTRYAAAFIDLKDDGTQEAIVYLTGPRWCGSGGCSSLILAPQGSSFRIITKTSVTRLPIRVLAEKTNSWHDLGVGVGGGGIRSGYEARLRFNGQGYPSNPTVPPSQRLGDNAEGTVVIPSDLKAVPLYRD